MNKNIELARTASSWVGRRITVFYLDAEGQSFPSGMGATITQDDDEYAIIYEARLDENSFTSRILVTSVMSKANPS